MNPELQRNLWIDATPRRLYGAAVAVLVSFAVVWLADRGRHAAVVTTAGAAMFVGAALAWAPRAARRSVVDEVVARTWDFQRLSALSPWALTWGKLAGATLRPWVVAAGGLAMVELQLASTSGLRPAGFWLIVALAFAVTVQAAGLATGLMDVRRGRASGRPLSGRAPGLAVLGLALLVFAALAWTRVRIGHLAHGVLGEVAPLGGQVWWWGRPHPPLAFAAASLVASAAWATVWAWRLMRLELQLTNAPWAWTLFCVGAALYAAGFDPPAVLEGGQGAATRLLGAAATLAGLAYVGAFAEPADRVRARQFAEAVRRGQAVRAGARLPLTALPSGLAVLTGLSAAMLHARTDAPATAVLLLAMLAFFVRDLGVIAWRRFAPSGEPSDLSVAAGLIALYGLGAVLGRLFGGEAGQAAFLPSGGSPGLSAALALLEAGAVWALAAVRIRRPSRRRVPSRTWRGPPPPTPAPCFPPSTP